MMFGPEQIREKTAGNTNPVENYNNGTLEQHWLVVLSIHVLPLVSMVV